MITSTSLRWLGSLCALTLLMTEADGLTRHRTPYKEACCEKAPHPMRVSARYTSPRGIGYKPGYSTLEGFFSKIYQGQWVPFLDLRGHLFDNGKFAANAGLGIRYLSHSRAWGINAYYDYRNTEHQQYNQVGVGLETLGKVWDVRLNGYLPVGTTQSSIRHIRFDEFKGHYIFLRSVRDFALKGMNLEVGAHVDHFKNAPLYFAAGPYYLTGKGATAWGGEFRTAVDLFHRLLRLEGNTSYDNYFRWIGQGQISLNFYFGGRSRLGRHCRSCSSEKKLYTRALQRVDRSEIIPVAKQHRRTKAINPATGDPYFFVFVDNTSHSLGTYESPYSSLAAAQANSSPGQIIYVFPGDNSSTNMDAGITLQNSQMLLGASISYPFPTTLGTISTPILASTLPILTNNAIAPVITLANDNLVSGLYIESNTSNGISGTGINNFTATQNTIIGSNPADALFLSNVTGQVTTSNNTFEQGNPNINSIHIQLSSSQCSFSSINDTFYCFPSFTVSNGIFADLSNTGFIETLSVVGGTFINSADVGDAIQAQLQDSSSISNLIVSNCSIIGWGNGVEADLYGTGSITNLTVSNSSLSNNSTGSGVFAYLPAAGNITNLAVSNSNLNNNTNGIQVFLDVFSTGSVTNLMVSDSNLNNNGGYSFSLHLDPLSAGSITNVEISGSSLNNNSNGGISYQVDGPATIENFIVTNCSISNNNNGIILDLNSTGKMSNVVVSNSNLSNNAGWAILSQFADSQSMDDFVVSNSILNNNNNGIGFIFAGADNSITNMTISGCTINNATTNTIMANLGGTSTITNMTVSNCSINDTATDAINVILNGSNSISNMTVSNCIFSNYINGLNTTGSGSINVIEVTGSSFDRSSGNGVLIGNNSISLVNVVDSTFTMNANGVLLSPLGTVSAANVLNSTFTANVMGVNMNPGGSISTGSVANNTFYLNTANGLLVSANSGSNVLSVTDNTYTGTLTPAPGYAASMTTNGGDLCLDFFHNRAIPVDLGSGNTPYLFNNAAATSFNLTAESTQANNTGTITQIGTLGSCTQ